MTPSPFAPGRRGGGSGKALNIGKSFQSSRKWPKFRLFGALRPRIWESGPGNFTSEYGEAWPPGEAARCEVRNPQVPTQPEPRTAKAGNGAMPRRSGRSRGVTRSVDKRGSVREAAGRAPGAGKEPTASPTPRRSPLGRRCGQEANRRRDGGTPARRRAVGGTAASAPGAETRVGGRAASKRRRGASAGKAGLLIQRKDGIKRSRPSAGSLAQTVRRARGDLPVPDIPPMCSLAICPSPARSCTRVISARNLSMRTTASIIQDPLTGVFFCAREAPTLETFSNVTRIGAIPPPPRASGPRGPRIRCAT